MLRVYIFSGGTEVTVIGSNLDSVAEPRITLTVIVTRFYNDTRSVSQVLKVEEHHKGHSVNSTTVDFHETAYFLWPPCVADADIIFLSCFFFLSFFSSPNLSGRRLDVYHRLLPHMTWP